MRQSLAALVLAASSTGHVAGADQAAAAPDLAASKVVLAAIRDQVTAIPELVGPAGDADVQFTRVPSLAVPGLVYWWGYYVPPNSFDIYYEPVAGEVAGTVKRLESTEDWLAMAVSAGWRPSSAAVAIEGCAEAVLVSSPERSQRFGNTLMRLAVTTVDPNHSKDASSAPQTFRSSVPRATRVSVAAWDVDFWMAEWGINHYRCQISAKSLRITRIGAGPSWMMGSVRPGG